MTLQSEAEEDMFGPARARRVALGDSNLIRGRGNRWLLLLGEGGAALKPPAPPPYIFVAL